MVLYQIQFKDTDSGEFLSYWRGDMVHAEAEREKLIASQITPRELTKITRIDVGECPMTKNRLVRFLNQHAVYGVQSGVGEL